MVKMRRIKLFESFDKEITEQEVRGALVELMDQGYDVLVTKTYNGYSVSISAEYFDIKNVAQPVLELIDYLTEKYGKAFVYSLEYKDVNTNEEVEIEDLEQFIIDNPLEDTEEFTIDLRVNL